MDSEHKNFKRCLETKISLIFCCFNDKIKIFGGFFREIMRVSVGLEREKMFDLVCVFVNLGKF